MPLVRGVAALSGILLAAAWTPGPAVSSPSLSTDRGCYRVGDSVQFAGSGFAAQRAYEVTIDGVDFGQARTDSSGALRQHVVPGGLPAGVAQSQDQLAVSDGTTEAGAAFTVTRDPGARFMATRGDPRTLRDRFQIWGFSLTGKVRAVYVHYVSPSGQARETVRLGRTGGQCGYLMTSPKRFFPFSPSTGGWTLQVDTRSDYSARPAGPVARIYVRIAKG